MTIFSLKKKRGGGFPCKQTEKKGITAVTMIMKPWTFKSHRREWWLLQCSILTKVQTASNTEHIRLKQEPQQTSAPLALEHDLLSSDKIPTSPGTTQKNPVSVPSCPQSEGDGFRLHPGQSTCITGPISRSMFINMYKSVTGT